MSKRKSDSILKYKLESRSETNRSIESKAGHISFREENA